jgi:hypothetical protein
MIQPGEIYYLSDQFGPKFISIIRLDELWITFYKCHSLIHIIKQPNNFFSKQVGKFICEKSQIKKWNLEKLIINFKYNNSFQGCIRIPNETIHQVVNSTLDTENHPYIEYKDDDYICKRISEQDFINIQLDKILDS